MRRGWSRWLWASRCCALPCHSARTRAEHPSAGFYGRATAIPRPADHSQADRSGTVPHWCSAPSAAQGSLPIIGPTPHPKPLHVVSPLGSNCTVPRLALDGELAPRAVILSVTDGALLIEQLECDTRPQEVQHRSSLEA